MYDIQLTRQAVKDAKKLAESGLKPKAVTILRVIRNDPLQNPPPYEKLRLYENTHSRRINIQHRLVYQVLPNQDHKTNEYGVLFQGIVKIIRMWTHYE